MQYSGTGGMNNGIFKRKNGKLADCVFCEEDMTDVFQVIKPEALSAQKNENNTDDIAGNDTKNSSEIKNNADNEANNIVNGEVNNDAIVESDNEINDEKLNVDNKDEACVGRIRSSEGKAVTTKGKAKRNNRRLIFAVVLATVVVSSLACLITALRSASDSGTNTPDAPAADASGTQTVIKQVSHEEMRGVWIASVSNINYPSKKGLSASQMAQEIDAILENCADIGFNTIFFQVRPAADALYRSDLYPWSQFVSGTQGVAPDESFDSLEYILSKAPQYGIDIHAWVNPFRVTTGSAQYPKHDVNELAEGHFARSNPDYVIPYADGKLYFDPGNPDVRKYVVSGIAELCEKYPELAGIHIDDYFYPYPVSGAEFDDSFSYSRYGEGMSLDDFRRNNVNLFVKEAYDTVKSRNQDMKFGVSPFGIWANSTSETPVKGSVSSGLEAYFSLYCDALAWVNGGYVDYLVPQDYWSFSTSAAPFDNIARWWNAQLDGTGVELYIGHAAYKAADYAKNEIATQVEFSRSLISYRGSVFYGYEDIKNNTAGVRDDIKKCYENYGGTNENSAIANKTLSINYPTSRYTKGSSGVIHGSSDPSKPVTMNGEKVSRTTNGYFSIYSSLAMGVNTFSFVSGTESKDFVISRVNTIPSGGTAANAEMEAFEIVSATPDKPLWLVPGDVVAVTCVAPSGSKVYATFGEYRVEMKPTIYSASTSKNYKETYKGSITVSKLYASEGEIADIGVLTVYAEKGGKKAQKTLSEVKQMGGNVKIYAQVKNDFSYLKRSTTSSFYGDPLSQSVGMRDYITAFVNGYYRLRCGYYISQEDVDVISGQALMDNSIMAVTVNTEVLDNTSNKNNSTNVSFAVYENVPVNAYAQNGKVFITFFNTDTTVIPEVVIGQNPMIKSGKGYIADGNLTYEFQLKYEENYYGFDIVYNNGYIILKLNNPQALKAGDKPLSGKTIVVDAGHGGTDMGALGPSQVGSWLHESDLNLGIALELKRELEQLGANVIMTREDDTTLPLTERAELICDLIPDLLISVHHNSVDDSINSTKTRGYLGLYYDASGMLLANSVSDVVCDELSRYQRKTSKQTLAVLRSHRFPGTLCEMSFISYVEEFQWSVTPGNFARSGKALADGVLEFYARQEKYLAY